MTTLSICLEKKQVTKIRLPRTTLEEQLNTLALVSELLPVIAEHNLKISSFEGGTDETQ